MLLVHKVFRAKLETLALKVLKVLLGPQVLQAHRVLKETLEILAHRVRKV